MCIILWLYMGTLCVDYALRGNFVAVVPTHLDPVSYVISCNVSRFRLQNLTPFI